MKWLPIEEKDLQQILDWRTREDITRFMYTDIEYDLNNQKKWLEKIRRDENGRYWLIEFKGELIGFISITDIHWSYKRAMWNFYIGNVKYGMLAGFLGAYVYNFAFNELGLLKMSGEVLDINHNVRKIHLMQGAREVGMLEQHVYKNGNWHDVYLFEMTKQRWDSKGIKYQKHVAEVITR